MPPRPKASPRSRGRREVLHAAAELFFEQGYDATSMADIAERVGILRASVYYYVGSKEEALFELIQDVYAGSLASLERARAAEADPLDKLHAVVEQHVLYLTANRLPTALFLTEFRSLTDAHKALAAADEAAYVRGVQAVIEEGQRQGAIRLDVDAKLATMGVLGALNWTYRWYRDDGGASAEEIASQFARMIVDGLARRDAA